jgi:hypothetical protein
VEQWTAGQNYLETAEFVESIPFTETREYVQIVIRNSDAYRSIYGPVSSGDREQTRLSTKDTMKTVAADPVSNTDAQPAAAGESR